MSVIPDGFRIEMQGQHYEFVGTDEHRTDAGERTDLLVWATDCAGCGRRVRVITPLVFSAPSLQCDRCDEPPLQFSRQLERVAEEVR